MRHWIAILSAFLSINLSAQNVKKVYVKVIDTSGIGGSVADTNYIVGQLDIIRGELADTAALLRSDISDSLAITEALLRSDISDSLANMVTDNIYIADGTLTGHREISADGYDLSITGGGNVGIGTSSPSAKLEINTGANTNTPHGTGDDFAIVGSANVGMTILGGDTGSSIINFGSESDNITAQLSYSYPNNQLKLSSNRTGASTVLGGGIGEDALTVLAGGNVGIGTTSPSVPLQIGTQTPTSTNDTQVSLGATYSGIRGLHPKINFYDDGATKYGIGISSNQMDFIMGSTNQDYVFYANQNELFRIEGTGNVGIGTTSPSVELDVIGDIEYTGTITDVSDERLKENFAPIDSALQKVIAINPILFTMKGSDRIESGYKAQNVQEHFSHVVKEVDEAGTLGMDYTQMISLLHQAIKDQQVLIENLEARIEELENQ